MRGFTMTGLPEGWMAKADPKGYIFISPTATQLIGKIKADAYLVQLGGSDQDRKMVAEFNFQGERGNPVKVPRVSKPALEPLVPQLSSVPKPDLSWQDGGYDLPWGWKTKGEGSTRKIMAPNGKVFPGLRWFLIMMLSEGYPPEVV